MEDRACCGSDLEAACGALVLPAAPQALVGAPAGALLAVQGVEQELQAPVVVREVPLELADTVLVCLSHRGNVYWLRCQYTLPIYVVKG